MYLCPVSSRQQNFEHPRIYVFTFFQNGCVADTIASRQQTVNTGCCRRVTLVSLRGFSIAREYDRWRYTPDNSDELPVVREEKWSQ